MIQIFKIKNIEDISPECKGHDLVLDSNHMCSHFMKEPRSAGDSPYFWYHFERSENPHLTQNHIIGDDGWVFEIDDVPLKNKSNSTAWYIELEEKADICRVGDLVIAMFQHPHVSYAQVIMKRNQDRPFKKAESIGDGKQIFFDLATCWDGSIDQAEQIFRGYSLIKNHSDLHMALDFVDTNLAAYYPKLFEPSK